MSRTRAPVLVWFRADLRLADNAALTAAAASGRPLLACFVLDETAERLGGASRWWLHHSLESLRTDLAERGVRLVLRRGPAAAAIAGLVRELGAAAVHAGASAEPLGGDLERRTAEALEPAGAALHLHEGALLFDPDAIRSRAGTPFKVFTPFWKACLERPAPGEPVPVPAPLTGFAGTIRGDALEDWRLAPGGPDWADGLEASWTPGEAGAHRRLAAFLAGGLAGYARDRDRPDVDATSRLSPHLHFGELGPRQVWHAVRTAAAAAPAARAGGDAWLRQLGWREFSHHLLHARPDLPHAAFRPAFDAFPWRASTEGLDAWQRGRTGYPIVDAGMRELWRTGWMHNRVRMVAASFLVKHLLIPWQRGAEWFWDTLVDADLANNSASWQWVAGSGADAAPYFRVFNPTLQGRKFDPDGDYVRRWLPELAALPAAHIHAPSAAPAALLGRCGIELGRDYPRPIVDHRAARERALAAYRAMRT